MPCPALPSAQPLPRFSNLPFTGAEMSLVICVMVMLLLVK